MFASYSLRSQDQQLALLVCLAPSLARVTGLEPATSGVTGRHSNQLSYTRSDREARL